MEGRREEKVKELIESYRHQLVAVADTLANEICGLKHEPGELVQLINCLLTVHAKVREYDCALFGGDGDELHEPCGGDIERDEQPGPDCA